MRRSGGGHGVGRFESGSSGRWGMVYDGGRIGCRFGDVVNRIVVHADVVDGNGRYRNGMLLRMLLLMMVFVSLMQQSIEGGGEEQRTLATRRRGAVFVRGGGGTRRMGIVEQGLLGDGSIANDTRRIAGTTFCCFRMQ